MSDPARSPFEIRLVEMYFGVPILEALAPEPTILTPEVNAQFARQLLEQPYERFAVVMDFRNVSYAASFGPDEEAQALRTEPFVEVARRAIAFVRFQASSMTSLVHGMRVNMLLQHFVRSHFAPDFESAVRAARRAIDRMEVPAT